MQSRRVVRRAEPRIANLLGHDVGRRADDRAQRTTHSCGGTRLRVGRAATRRAGIGRRTIGLVESGPFTDVGSIFPGDIDLCTVEPGTLVRDALALMAANRYSQLPVVSNSRVRGVFSLWSMARQMLGAPELNPLELSVGDVMERIPSVTVADSLDLVLEHLDRHDAVLVESPRGVQAIATASDVLAYFDRIARPFVLLQEIELALRALIEGCVEEERLQLCISVSLAKKYENRRMPSRLVEMSFDEYRTIVTARDNWPLFEEAFGGNRAFVSAKLSQVGRIRNELFHFRGSASVVDHQTLAAMRHWLFDKAQAISDELGEAVS